MVHLLPMLASAGPLPADSDAWVFEGKWDGLRALVLCGVAGVSIRSRRDLDMTSSWPELARLGDGIPDGTLLDGEIVTLAADGKPSFARAQKRMNLERPSARLVASYPAVFMAFDLLRLADHDITALPWSKRRELLEHLDLCGVAVQVPPAFPGPGAAVFDACVAAGLEGVVAKRVDAPYQPGQRSHDWIKVKRVRRQEVVIAGWEAGEGRRAGHVGALLLGVYDGDSLVYCGKVGTGFTYGMLDEVWRRLSSYATDTTPYAAGIPDGVAPDVHWVRPALVCEVEFLEWTTEGKLRFPTYKGLRFDKDPTEVRRD